MHLIIKELAVGPIMANCFILGCEKTKSAVVIDPGRCDRSGRRGR